MYKLKSMRIINFQTWKDSVVNFSDGLTVIEGENNSGKSALFKALKITADSEAFNKEDRVQLIRHGKPSARIVYTFSDGVSYIVDVLSKENGYYVCEDDEISYEGMALPNDLRNRLGFLIGESGIIGNLVDMDQNMFLVNSDDKLNYNILKLLTSDEDLDKLIRELEQNKLPKAKSMLNSIKSYKKIAESRLSEFDRIDVTRMKAIDNLLEENMCILELLHPAFKGIKDLEIKDTIDDSVMNKLSSLIELESLLSHIEVMSNRKSVDLSIYDLIEIEDIINSINGSSKISKIDVKVDLQLLEEIEDALPRGVRDFSKLSIDVDLNSLSDIEMILNDINKNSIELDKNLSGLDSAKKELSELDIIEGDCPKYGKVMILNGECSPKV